jgi:hypothetical protein
MLLSFVEFSGDLLEESNHSLFSIEDSSSFLIRGDKILYLFL